MFQTFLDTPGFRPSAQVESGAKSRSLVDGCIRIFLRRALTQASTFRIKKRSPETASAFSWKYHIVYTATAKDSQNENPTTWVDNQ